MAPLSSECKFAPKESDDAFDESSLWFSQLTYCAESTDDDLKLILCKLRGCMSVPALADTSTLESLLLHGHAVVVNMSDRKGVSVMVHGGQGPEEGKIRRVCN